MAISRLPFLIGGASLAVPIGGLAWLDVRFNPHTSMHYPLPPDSAKVSRPLRVRARVV